MAQFGGPPAIGAGTIVGADLANATITNNLIAPGVIANDRLQNMPAGTLKMNTAGAPGAPQDGTPANALLISGWGQPYARATLSANQALAANVATVIAFDTATYGVFDTVNHRWQPGVTGIYRMSWVMSYALTPILGTTLLFMIRQNGVGINNGIIRTYFADASAITDSMVLTEQIKVLAADVIDFTINSTVALTMSGGALGPTSFAGHYIGV